MNKTHIKYHYFAKTHSPQHIFLNFQIRSEYLYVFPTLAHKKPIFVNTC